MDVLGFGRSVQTLERILSDREFPIIVLSASTSEEDARAVLTAGADAFLSKPIDLSHLQSKIGELLQLTWTYGPTVTEQQPEPDTLVVPPAAEMELLYELAKEGSMPRRSGSRTNRLLGCTLCGVCARAAATRPGVSVPGHPHPDRAEHAAEAKRGSTRGRGGTPGG
jgi:DNA-binding NarL/FixJ family response regulator